MSQDTLLPAAPAMQEPPSRFSVKPNASPGFIIGATDKPHDIRIVARTIGVRAVFRLRDREFSAPSNLHELAVAKRFYEAQGGTISYEPGWVPGLQRSRNLTHAELVAEVQRMAETYRIPRESGFEDVFSQFFGAERSEQVRRVHALMRQQLEDWTRLLASCAARLDARILDEHPALIGRPDDEAKRRDRQAVIASMAADLITPADLERIVSLADPSATASELVLPALPAAEVPLASAGPTAAPAVDMRMTGEDPSAANPAEAMVDALTAAGVDQSQALQLAALLDIVGDGSKLTDDQIREVVGASKEKLRIVRTVIKG